MIEINDLEFGFGKKKIIDNVSFCFENKRYVLLGDNGCGKTTFFRCLYGYYLNCKGKVTKDGGSNLTIGYLPQKFGLYNTLTVKENLEYIANLRGIKNVKQEVKKVIGNMRLENEIDKKVRELSGGMLQRLGIAQALMGDPDILLLDEPTVGLDIGQRRNFYETLNSLDVSCPIIISTHIPEDAKNFSEEIIVMKDGKLFKTDWNLQKDNIEEKYLCFH